MHFLLPMYPLWIWGVWSAAKLWADICATAENHWTESVPSWWAFKEFRGVFTMISTTFPTDPIPTCRKWAHCSWWTIHACSDPSIFCYCPLHFHNAWFTLASSYSMNALTKHYPDVNGRNAQRPYHKQYDIAELSFIITPNTTSMHTPYSNYPRCSIPQEQEGLPNDSTASNSTHHLLLPPLATPILPYLQHDLVSNQCHHDSNVDDVLILHLQTWSIQASTLSSYAALCGTAHTNHIQQKSTMTTVATVPL